MNAQLLSEASRPAVKRPRGINIIAGADALLLGLLPIFFAILGFLGNFLPLLFSFPGTLIMLIAWYAPLEWYIMNGRLIYSDLDFFVGHGLASLIPGIVLLIAAISAWRGRATSRNVLLALVIIVNLLNAIAVLTIRSFGPFPSWEILSRWLFSGILIGLNAWYFLRPSTRIFYQQQ